MIEMLLMTTGAGACIVLGGLLARAERVLPRWLDAEFRHSVIAFGGGVLVAAVALVLVPLGPVFGAMGWYFGPPFPVFFGAVMLFAAGGILYLIFQDIAPQAHLQRHWGPSLGAVFGFSLGMLGDLLIKH